GLFNLLDDRSPRHPGIPILPILGHTAIQLLSLRFRERKGISDLGEAVPKLLGELHALIGGGMAEVGPGAPHVASVLHPRRERRTTKRGLTSTALFATLSARPAGRSFNGRTCGSGPQNRGSSPCLPAKRIPHP